MSLQQQVCMFLQDHFSSLNQLLHYNSDRLMEVGQLWSQSGGCIETSTKFVLLMKWNLFVETFSLQQSGIICRRVHTNGDHFVFYLSHFLSPCQAFINTAKEIYEKIQEGVFDINNEVRR